MGIHSLQTNYEPMPERTSFDTYQEKNEDECGLYVTKTVTLPRKCTVPHFTINQ